MAAIQQINTEMVESSEALRATAAKLKGDVDLTSHKGSILATAEKIDSEEASGAGARQF